MTVDHDGKDPHGLFQSYAMARLVALKDKYQGFRQTILTRTGTELSHGCGLMNPNHYLAVAIQYLLTHRPQWRHDVAAGKTLVSSSMIDRVVRKLGRELREVPVGFKMVCVRPRRRIVLLRWGRERGRKFPWRGRLGVDDRQGWSHHGLAGRRDHRANRQRSGEHYRELTAEFGTPYYTRIDAPATPEQKAQTAQAFSRAVKNRSWQAIESTPS